MSSDTLTNDIRHEANTALLEVDKGLRSVRVSDQCEAIVKFPLLVDRFPFPVLINTAFLKIAEVFRMGNNFLRLNILKVLQLTEKHLQKIISTDEFIRRIYSVIHSNDSLARAVTLRVFGTIASIVTERKNIHHSIHQGLESTDNVEMDAAIYATSCLCRHSRTFATGVCEKITVMVQGLTTPVAMKLRLFPILTLMQQDMNIATQVREVCLKLLPAYPSLAFVIAILQTLTELSVATLTHIPDQMKLLLCYASGDARLSVRLKAYGQLLHLAIRAPHTWTEPTIRSLVSVMVKSSLQEQVMGCRVLYKLATSLEAVHNMTFIRDEESFLSLCYSQNLTVAAYSVGVVTHVVMATVEGVESKKGKEEVEDIGAAVVGCLLLVEHSEDREGDTVFKVLLSSLVLLAVSPTVRHAALEALLGILPTLGGSRAVLVCQTLASIAGHTPGMCNHISPKLLEYLDSRTKETHKLILPVLAVVMQLHQGELGSPERQHFRHKVCPSLLSHVWGLDHASRFWVAYKVAHKASMMGFHMLAESVYFKLSRMVTTVKFRCWLNALYQFSLSQSLLSSSSSPSGEDTPPSSTTDLIPALNKTSAIICNTMMLLKASSPSSSFPYEFLQVHNAWLNAYYQLLATCVSVDTLPPPTSGQGHHLEKKLRMCVAQFQTVSESYSNLYSSLFDADLPTLEYISLLQQSCLLMASVISSIGLSRKPLVSPGKVSTPLSETPLGQVEISDNFNTSYLLGRACQAVFQHSQVMSSSLQSLPFGDEHTTAILDCCRMLLQVPIQLPKYFFTSTQVTNVKLALSPPLPASGQHVSVSPNHHFTLKVEGIVENSGCGNARLFRSPTAVYVQVSPKLERLFSSDAKPPELTSQERTEPIEKDYFQAEFLLNLPAMGYYSVQVEARLLDNDGRVWNLGHRVKMSVVVESKETVKKQDSVLQSSGGGVGSGGKGGGSSLYGGHKT